MVLFGEWGGVVRFTEAGANTKGCPQVPSVSKIKKNGVGTNGWMDGRKKRKRG